MNDNEIKNNNIFDKLPENYKSSMQELLKEDVNSYFSCLADKSYKGIRINNLKISNEEFEKICPFEIEKIPFVENGYYVKEEDNVSKHPYYYAGLYYIQEPSAMLPANRLPINEDDRVLDLCAAPGGKATELASKLNGSGILYANDISASRAKALLKNLEMCGAKNFYVTAESPDNLAKYLPKFFTKILVDAPCSGEGMFRKDDSLIKSWIERGPEYYSQIQREILDSAYNLLSDGGLLMYSTCTFSPLEDELSISYLLNKYDDLELIDIVPFEGFSNGIKDLNRFIFENNESDLYKDSIDYEKCVRIFPHKMKGEGHFLALIHKKGNIEENEKTICKEFIDKNKCKYVLPGYKDNGYRKGIRYLRTGLFLSDESKNKIRYADSYALTLKKDEFENCFKLKVDDIRVIKYLKGETIFVESDETLNKGYVLILVDGFPLGFATNDGRGTLKNMYNKAFRMN